MAIIFMLTIFHNIGQLLATTNQVTSLLFQVVLLSGLFFVYITLKINLLLRVGKIFLFGEASQIISFSLALFGRLQLDLSHHDG